MTRFFHDRFAKDYLSETLFPLGALNINQEVPAETRFIDIYFTPMGGALDCRFAPIQNSKFKILIHFEL